MDIQHVDMYRDVETDLYPPSTLTRIVLTNETEGHTFSEWIEQYPTEQAPTFKELQKEYGKCTSRVYIGAGEPIGWFFVSRQRYEDSGEMYLRGAWVTLEQLPALDFLPATVREAHQATELMKVGA